MGWFSLAAVYLLFWVLSAFLVLPWGIRSHDDDASVERVAGQVTSAPINFRPKRIALRATLLSIVLCGLFFANRHYGWLSDMTIAELVPMPASLQSGTIYR